MECEWKFNEEEESWDTSCGDKFIIIDGKPSDNSMKFCCYCSYELKEISKK